MNATGPCLTACSQELNGMHRVRQALSLARFSARVWLLYMVHRLEHWNEGLMRGHGLGGNEHQARDSVMSAFMYVVLLGVAYFADKSVESHPVANRYCTAIAD